MNPNTFRHLSYGVYVISTWDQERPTGCTANSAMQVTSSPATLAISINHDNYTNRCIAEDGRFAVSILSEQSDPAIIGNFGFQSGKDVNKFDKAEYQLCGGLPVIADACGYIVCEVIDKMETSTHTVFLGEVKDAEVLKGGEAMTYAYYHKVIKGRSPKAAPTYIADETAAGDEAATTATFANEEAATTGTAAAATAAADIKKYVCQVCGHIYEGAALPDDYICPICGVGSDRFKELRKH